MDPSHKDFSSMFGQSSQNQSSPGSNQNSPPMQIPTYFSQSPFSQYLAPNFQNLKPFAHSPPGFQPYGHPPRLSTL
jgi:hypothetical protein